MIKYKAIMVVGVVLQMIRYSYKVNQGKHTKLSNGKINDDPVTAKFSDEEIYRVESKDCNVRSCLN